MSSFGIDYLREKYPGKTDTEVAEAFAKESGFIVIVGYKSNESAEGFTDFGACRMEEEVGGYLSSPYCHDVEVLYDGRSGALRITESLILSGACAACNRPATQESLTLMGGNDFYICPSCGQMFCSACYPRLPLTDGDSGYGMCPRCMVEVQRAVPGFYGTQSG